MSSKTAAWSTEFKGFLIEVLMVEWETGDVWEYRVSRNEQTLTESESEYGTQASAISDAFKWIDEESDLYTIHLEDAAEQQQQAQAYTITTTSTGERYMTFKIGGSKIQVQVSDDPEEPERILRMYRSIAAPVNDYINWVEADRRDKREPDEPEQA